MELTKTKYKTTEIGLIPEDWEVKSLGEVGKINMGQSPLSSNYNNQGIGLPLVQGNADVKNRKTIIRQFTSQVPKKANAGEIIMSVRAPVGEISKTDFDCCIGRGVCSIHYENDFLYHYLIFFENSWGQFSTGSTFDSINSNQVKSILIPIPPNLTEQKAIATALSDVDALISSLEKLITKKKAIKQGAMQELLTPPQKGGKRLPGFSGEWEEKTLNDLSTNISSGSSNTTSEVGNYPLYGSTGQIGTKKYKDYSGKRLLVARVGANAGTLYKVSGDYCVSDNTLMISVTYEIDINFLFFKLKKYNLSKLIFGSGQPLVTGGQLKGVMLYIPKLEEQIAIAQILSDMDAEIEALEAKKAKYQGIKQGMMQELLTGKTRLVQTT